MLLRCDVMAAAAALEKVNCVRSVLVLRAVTVSHTDTDFTLTLSTSQPNLLFVGMIVYVCVCVSV